MTESYPWIGCVIFKLMSLQTTAYFNAPGVLESGGACRVR